MSNSGIRNIQTPTKLEDFHFEPMNPKFRARDCRVSSCTNPATMVRYKKDIFNVPDKSSKTFVCDEHMTGDVY